QAPYFVAVRARHLQGRQVRDGAQQHEKQRGEDEKRLQVTVAGYVRHSRAQVGQVARLVLVLLAPVFGHAQEEKQDGHRNDRREDVDEKDNLDGRRGQQRRAEQRRQQVGARLDHAQGGVDPRQMFKRHELRQQGVEGRQLDAFAQRPDGRSRQQEPDTVVPAPKQDRQHQRAAGHQRVGNRDDPPAAVPVGPDAGQRRNQHGGQNAQQNEKRHHGARLSRQRDLPDDGQLHQRGPEERHGLAGEKERRVALPLIVHFP